MAKEQNIENEDFLDPEIEIEEEYEDENEDDYDERSEYHDTDGFSTDGIKLISAYHFVWALLLLLMMCAVSVPTVITGIVGIAEDPEVFIATAILGFIVSILMLLSAIYGAVGYGLWTRRQWARTAALALGVMSLPAIPIGTLGGGVTIWYLLKDRVARQFQ